MSAPGLWAITSYFNPLGYKRRLANYRAFHARLGVPVIAVELGTARGYELTDADAELLVRVPQGAVVWQKERLLNLALRSLPEECAAAAWIDADVIFGNHEWPHLAMRELDRVPLVQLFEGLYHVRPTWREDSGMPRAEEALMRQHSMASAIAREGDARGPLGGATARGRGAASPGVAWAARRDLLDELGFYDGCIIGGGDTALACAAYGCTDVVERLHSMNAAMASRYRAWAERFHERVGGNVAYIPGDLFHLWHGHLTERGASTRHEGLAPFAFDPNRDVVVNPHGAWDWATDKGPMHAYVREYFASRNEDGARPRSMVGRPLPMSRMQPLHGRTTPRVLIVRHPDYHREFYDIVFQWLEVNFPELVRVFQVLDLPADDADWDNIVLHHAWLQDPVQMWSPEAFARARQIAASCDAMGIPVINRVERLTHARHTERRHVDDLGLTALEHGRTVGHREEVEFGRERTDVRDRATVDTDALVDNALANDLLGHRTNGGLDLTETVRELVLQVLDDRRRGGVEGLVASRLGR